MARTFWGNALKNVVGGVVGTAALPFAVARGAVSAAKGESFEKGFEGTFHKLEEIMPSAQAFEEFGDKHADHIEKTLITGTVIAMGAVAKTKLLDPSSNNTTPPQQLPVPRKDT